MTRRPAAMLSSYIFIDIPLKEKAPWLHSLERFCQDRFQADWHFNFHITLAFIDDTKDCHKVAEAVGKVLEGRTMPALCFDTLDVFTAQHSKKQIINLTCSNPPAEFSDLVREIRTAITQTGNVLNSEFKLHMTLAEATPDADIVAIDRALRQFVFPGVNLTLRRPVYREFRGRTIRRY